MAVDDLKNAIGGDVIISGLNRPGGASPPDILASRRWYDRHRGGADDPCQAQCPRRAEWAERLEGGGCVSKEGSDAVGTQFAVTWLANVTGMDEDGLPAFGRIGAGSAYRPDDAFVVGWREIVEAESLDAVPEIMWATHNADDRSSGRTCRSMCIGDVVVVGEIAFACERFGFRRLDAAPQVLLPGTFVEHVTALRNR